MLLASWDSHFIRVYWWMYPWSRACLDHLAKRSMIVTSSTADRDQWSRSLAPPSECASAALQYRQWRASGSITPVSISDMVSINVWPCCPMSCSVRVPAEVDHSSNSGRLGLCGGRVLLPPPTSAWLSTATQNSLLPPPSPLTVLCRGIFGRWPTQFSLCQCCICCSWYRGSEASCTADSECVIDRDHSYLWSHVIAEYSLRSDRDQTLIEASPK